MERELKDKLCNKFCGGLVDINEECPEEGICDFLVWIEQAFLSSPEWFKEHGYVKVEEEELASIKDLVCTWFCSSERCECDTKTCRVYLKLINPLLALDRKQGKPDWEKMPKIGQPKRWSWVQGEKVREACIAYAQSECQKCRGEK